MKILFLLSVTLSVTLTSRLTAQRPDLDKFSREVDLSHLDPSPRAPETDTNTGSPPPPSTHLFAGFEVLPPLPDAEENAFIPLTETGIMRLELPAAEYLVVPNPPRIDLAYFRLAEALEQTGNLPAFPLKVVLHADSKFSVAIALNRSPVEHLPRGVDISPLPPVTLLGRMADIQLLQKDHPPFLEAFQDLRAYARSAGYTLDTTEFYVLPRQPGRVFFALRIKNDSIKNDSGTGDLPIQP